MPGDGEEQFEGAEVRDPVVELGPDSAPVRLAAARVIPVRLAPARVTPVRAAATLPLAHKASL